MSAGPLRSRVRAEYDTQATSYDRRWNRYVTATVRETIRRIPGGSLTSALDIGCGTGSLLEALAERHPACRIAGMDLSLSMLATAERRLQSRAALAAGDAERLPFAAQSFDLVTSSSSLHFWTNPDAALLECRRVLRPEGHLVITDWCDDYLLCRICDRLLRIRYGDDHRVYGTADCQQLLHRAGFELLYLDTYKISWLWGLMTAVAKRSIRLAG